MLNVSGEKFVVIYFIYYLSIYNLLFVLVLQMSCQKQNCLQSYNLVGEKQKKNEFFFHIIN